MKKKVGNENGFTTLVLILLAGIVVLAVLLAIPSWKSFRYESEQIACTAALKSARDSLSIDYLGRNSEQTVDDAVSVVSATMDRWKDLCPDHGTVYVVKTESGEPPYTLVCGLHDPDTKKRTRLNAEYVKSQIDQKTRATQGVGGVGTVEVNGRKYEVCEVSKPVEIYRGTDLTDGVKGTVVYCTVRDGSVVYYLFADPWHCAVWDVENGWSGDCFK